MKTTDNLAVLVIDMQLDFVGRLRKEDKKNVISNLGRVLYHCRLLNIPIFVLEWYGHGRTIDEIRTYLTGLGKIEYVEKYDDDGFKKTKLKDLLKSYDIKKIFLTGINASSCVAFTARAALLEGFEVITSPEVIADAAELRKKRSWSRSLNWYSSHCTCLDSVEEFLN